MMLVANDKTKCSGCGACLVVCPCSAISMLTDEYGFSYASLDDSICIKCGKCHSVCPLLHTDINNTPIETYAAVSNSTEVLTSSSGGIFAALAKYIIENNGSVYGAIYQKENNKLTVTHKGVSSFEEIEQMKGSKYVQSSMQDVYLNIKKDMASGKRVLFCGTPCQCRAVKSYTINNKNYNNLLLVDIVCHGVPSVNMFSDFIVMMEKQLKCSILSFNFRDKEKGWGASCSIDYIKDGEKKKRYFYPAELSYYSLFLNCTIMRPACYNCGFAKESRVGDITIGDYWGIRIMQPELLVTNGGCFDERKGVSLLLVNTEKGKKVIDELGGRIEKRNSTLNALKCSNPQLSRPTTCKEEERDQYLQAYSVSGYQGVENLWEKNRPWQYYIRLIINRIPLSIKRNSFLTKIWRNIRS